MHTLDILLFLSSFFFLPSSQLDNDIALEPPTPAVLEQVVELSILLTGEMYSDNLDDPASLQYQTLSRQLAEKVCPWLSAPSAPFMAPLSAAFSGSTLDSLYLLLYGL